MTGSASRKPLGAHWDGSGVDFRIYSAAAKAMTLCLFDSGGSERRIAMDRENAEDGVWHARVNDARPGTLYGYRAHGPFAPQHGHFFNPTKLLVDPYARAVTGEPVAHPSLFGFKLGENPAHSFDGLDSAPHMPKCVVVDTDFSWQGIERPNIPWDETVIYETHVRGMTRLHPEIDPELRGTYLGLIQEPMLRYLLDLGITAVELLPVFQSAPEAHLLHMGKRNHWGYSPISLFAPQAHYATEAHHVRPGAQVDEFKTMVRELHRAGLEVILDVVFNHTAEGGLHGPLYGPKGLDARTYYRMNSLLPGRWIDYTGCGNTLNMDHPRTLQWVLDSLRYWVEEMQVDGFRFDLGPAVGRHDGEFRTDAPIFRALAEDPVLSTVKWIAEPWDLGPHGYRLGGFPTPWREWNDRYRDTVRRFWSGRADAAVTDELARRLQGSPDIFPSDDGTTGEDNCRSLNYVLSHDGFTLTDWTRYERKRNEANGEQNRDGTDNNLSNHWGAEGETDDPTVLSYRHRARLNVLASLLFSCGTPMLQHGDEMGRSQLGNNNPYCQDNEIAWTDWTRPDRHLIDQVRALIALRRRFPQLRRAQHDPWIRVDPGAACEDVARTLMFRIPSPSGPTDLLLILFGGPEPTTLELPTDRAWQPLFDSAPAGSVESPSTLPSAITRPAFSLLLATAEPTKGRSPQA